MKYIISSALCIAVSVVLNSQAATLTRAIKNAPVDEKTVVPTPTDPENESSSSSEEKRFPGASVIPAVKVVGREEVQLNPGEVESEPEKVTLPPQAAPESPPAEAPTETLPNVETPAETEDSSSSSSSSSSSEESGHHFQFPSSSSSSSSEEYWKKKEQP